MNYRTVEIHWMPHTSSEWRTFTASRKEAARLWGDLVTRHHRIRRRALTWPRKARWERWAKGRYPGLSAQSTQQILGEFCEAVNSTRQLRKNGHDEASYPWKNPDTAMWCTRTRMPGCVLAACSCPMAPVGACGFRSRWRCLDD